MLKNTVGIIGLGIMGSAMSANLVKAGFYVLGFDPVSARRRELKRAGGRTAKSGRDVAGRSPIIITSMPSADAIASRRPARGCNRCRRASGAADRRPIFARAEA